MDMFLHYRLEAQNFILILFIYLFLNSILFTIPLLIYMTIAAVYCNTSYNL